MSASEDSEKKRADSYRTIERCAEAEVKIKGSRFIARVYLSESAAAVDEILAERRRVEYNATHHCWAYRLGHSVVRAGEDITPEMFRYSDDGEPHDSAGKPIFDQIKGRDLTNTLVVVTRFYGGTKLGVGGLVRAYSQATAEVLDKAGVQEKFVYCDYRLSYSFPDHGKITDLISRLRGIIDSSEYSEKVDLKIRVRLSLSEQFVSDFTELTHGKGKLESS